MLASSRFEGGLVLAPTTCPEPPLRLPPHDDARYIAVSPDGRWVATGSHWGTKVKIWDARTGELVTRVARGNRLRVRFSPGRQLAGHHRRRLPLVGRRFLAGRSPDRGQICSAFSPDGKFLAVETGHGVVRLVDPDTGREYARLEDPNQDRAFRTELQPGRHATGVATNDSHVDPRLGPAADPGAVGQDGAGLGPAAVPAGRCNEGRSAAPSDRGYGRSGFRGAAVCLGEVHLGNRSATDQPGGLPPPRLRVLQPGPVARGGRGFELGARPGTGAANSEVWHRRAHAYRHLARWDEARADYSKVIELDPENTRAHNNLAWLLTTCPDAQLRDTNRAIELAQKAVALAPRVAYNWNTLGVAHYRAGKWQAAIEALTKSMELRQGGDSFDWFFLALAHEQRGENEKARTWYDRAVEWMEKNQPRDEELKRFRAEAAALLGI